MKILIISTALVVIVLIAVVINNRIIVKKNQLHQAFASIEIYLKKRFDLIPNLVAMLKTYMAHEKEILLKVTELRSSMQSASSVNERIKVSNELTHLWGSLNVSLENYPNLKADEQFANIQFELSDIEDQISAARRAYNAAVTHYNDTIQMFPASLIAGIRKDRVNALLDIPKSDQKVIHINQLLNQ